MVSCLDSLTKLKVRTAGAMRRKGKDRVEGGEVYGGKGDGVLLDPLFIYED